MAMFTRLLAVLAAGLTLIATVVYATGVAGAESNGGVRVMPLGDSITDGLTVPGGYRINLWQKMVADGRRVDFVGSLFNGPSGLGDHDHEGHSGWRIDQVDANIVNWSRTYTPRTVLLHIGTNDMYQNPSGAAGRLGTLLDRIFSTAPDTYVFVATIIPLNGADATVRAFNASIPGLVQTRAAAGRRIFLVDMYSKLTTADLADGVHPNAGGYAKMATAWYDALRAVPASLEGGGTPTPTPTVTPTPTPTPTPGSTFRLRNQSAGRCVDSPTNAGSGTRVQLWDCHGNTNQQWIFNSSGTVTSAAGGLCLDVNGTSNTAAVIVRTCDGRAGQNWTKA
ncbi:ricin-type beta-trefoil lectin domain protein [Sphaerisporangium corydalis]|uniref:Ricin-type beta-trefoil lectin domain protein n=1 Tax=Sphaerisporangium corydalis TaxID=1441875 RepID=A0ABV9ENZ2_9ACTN|nr:ricin-type beta-trefoil lectin domain protein [Sphaerisporangium corydalis]